MITRIATAAVYVEDQQLAIDFWTKQMGFVVHRTDQMGPHASWIEVAPPAAESCLVLYPKSMMKDWAERKPSIVFTCDNVRRTYDEMASKGVRFSQRPQPMPWGDFAIFEDPDGNSYGLRQAR